MNKKNVKNIDIVSKCVMILHTYIHTYIHTGLAPKILSFIERRCAYYLSISLFFIPLLEKEVII